MRTNVERSLSSCCQLEVAGFLLREEMETHNLHVKFTAETLSILTNRSSRNACSFSSLTRNINYILCGTVPLLITLKLI
jgi:hypothetical protein